MAISETDKSRIQYARLAGFMFLFVDAAYLTSLFITTRLKVQGNFAESSHRILLSEQLYRLGLSSGLVAGLCTVLLAFGLYVAVKPIDKNLALLALSFRLVEATIFGVLVVVGFAALNLYAGADSLGAFSTMQLAALVSLPSIAASAGFNVAAAFFSMGSILFFYLFLKGNAIPKVLSLFGLAGSVLVPAICFLSLILPQHAKTLQLGWLPLGVAEIAVGLWLLVKGIRVETPVVHNGDLDKAPEQPNYSIKGNQNRTDFGSPYLRR